MNKLRFLAHPFTWGIIALLLLLTLLTPWVYPGEAVSYLAHLTGAWHTSAETVAAHPLTTLLFGALGKALPVSVSLPLFNVLTVLFGALCVTALCQITRHCVHYLADEPRTVPSVNAAANCAVPVAGIALLVSPVFLRAASHFQWQVFDLFLALSTILLLFRMVQRPTLSRAAMTAFIWGVIAFSSAEYLVLTPFFAIVLTWMYCIEQKRIHVQPLIKGIIVPMAVGALLTFALSIFQLLTLQPHLPFTVATLRRALLLYGDILTCFKGPWILVLLTGILPGILSLFILREAGKNRRTPTLFNTFIAVTVLAVLAVVPQALSLNTLLQPWGENYLLILPCLTAFAFAGLVATGVLFCQVKRRAEAAEELAFIRPFCRAMGSVALVALPIALGISAVMITFPTLKEDVKYATLPRDYTDAILTSTKAADGSTTETWLLSDGLSDAYLSLRVAQQSLPVTVFSLTQNKNTRALNVLRESVNQSDYFKQKPELVDTLSRALDIGMIPFIQDWIRADAGAEQHFVTIGLPDLWYTGNRLPLPQYLWYRGVSDRPKQHAALAVPTFEGALQLEKNQLSEVAYPTLRAFHANVLRQQGFILNNIAFYLADAGKTEEAYQLFRKVYADNDNNVSALFNTFELINSGLHPEDRAWCEQEISDRIRILKNRRYELWALARTYGYIRSPKLISMLVGGWAMSGQTGAALSGLDLALAMLDDGKGTLTNQLLVSVYQHDPKHRSTAIQKYRELLSSSTDRRQSLVYVRELVRMNILDGNLQAAKEVLEQVDPTGDAVDLAYERALWFATAGQPERARASLEVALNANPRNTEALAMMATLQLQADELNELTANTLPKLKTAAGTEDNYFVQIVTAQIAEKNNQLKKARTSYLRALALKPEVHNLRNTILTLDIRLNDKLAAAQHAKDFLYQDRSLPLANYIMGSLALSEGDPKRALSYLTQATAPEVDPPMPEAFNDLAEAHRQLGDWTSALAAAEHACKLSPNLAIARETAAAALLELGRYAEAHAYLKEAFELDATVRAGKPTDPRLLITRARVYEKEGRADLARVDLVAAREQYDALDRKAKAEFDLLAEKVQLQ